MPSAPGSLDEGDAVAELPQPPQQQESLPAAIESLPEDVLGENDERVLLREKVTADSNEGMEAILLKEIYNGYISNCLQIIQTET